uniref:Uncharacterized protein n=1 Tax=Arundo donax TaxID=35708 RepID=A0A0A9C3W2_ARUDO
MVTSPRAGSTDLSPTRPSSTSAAKANIFFIRRRPAGIVCLELWVRDTFVLIIVEGKRNERRDETNKRALFRLINWFRFFCLI